METNRGRRAVLALALTALAAGSSACVSAYPRRAIEKEVDDADRSALASPPIDLDKEEAALAKEARLRPMVLIALAKNPDVAEARARSRAALERVSGTSRLPDLVFKYQLWGAPLPKVWDVGHAQAHMFGVSQTFPAWGSLDAQSRIAAEEVRVLVELQHARELDVVSKVEKAYFDYYRADREIAIHREHMGLVHAAVDLVRVAFGNAKATQADVLRVSLEVTRLHNEIIGLEQQRTTDIAQLNTLLARNVDAPLGAPADVDVAAIHPQLSELEKLVRSRRPELVAADHAVKKGEASVEAAKATARNPEVMVGVDYMLMPGTDMPHNYGVMIAMSLPWLNPRHGEEVRAAEKSLVADKKALEALVTAAVFQLRDAASRLSSAQKSYELLDAQLLPAAQKSFEATRVAYANGQSDSIALLESLRTYLDVRIDRLRAVSRLGMSLADLERVVGVELVRATKSSSP